MCVREREREREKERDKKWERERERVCVRERKRERERERERMRKRERKSVRERKREREGERERERERERESECRRFVLEENQVTAENDEDRNEKVLKGSRWKEEQREKRNYYEHEFHRLDVVYQSRTMASTLNMAKLPHIYIYI